MKNLTLKLIAASLFALTSVVSGATSAIDVTVSDPSGKVAYKGKTNAQGIFSTGQLQPGNYVVQFKGQNVEGDHAIVIAAGKKKVAADLVSPRQFRGGGVAMKVEVGAGLNITGQVAEAATARAAGSREKVTRASRDSLGGMQDRALQGAVLVPGRGN